MNTVSSLMKNRNNNYDFIRLMAAITVIFSHSFPLSMGFINGKDPDPLNRLTNAFSLGSLSVMVFFIISGFLITQSYDKSRNPWYFLKARALRIFPALIFIVILTITILGPFVTTLSRNEYFSSHSTYSYLKNILLYMVFDLPGVFEHNAFPNSVNGALWTLPYEFRCYLLVLILGMTRLLRKEVVLLIFILSSVLNIMGYGGYDIKHLLYFAVGMMFYMFRDYIKLNFTISIAASIIAALCLMFYNPVLLPLIVICISYVIMQLTYNTKAKINLSKYGDFSYGTYICGCPIQQTITHCFGGHMDWWLNFIIALPLTLIMAMVSWHLIEKNALKLKNWNNLLFHKLDVQ